MLPSVIYTVALYHCSQKTSNRPNLSKRLISVTFFTYLANICFSCDLDFEVKPSF